MASNSKSYPYPPILQVSEQNMQQDHLFTNSTRKEGLPFIKIHSPTVLVQASDSGYELCTRSFS